MPTLSCNLQCRICGLIDNLKHPERMPSGTSFSTDPYDQVHWTWGENLKYSEIDTDQLKESLGKIAVLAAAVPGADVQQMPALTDADIQLYYTPAPLPVSRRKPCRMFWKSAFISPDGSVMPSQICYFHPMGNLLRSSFREIWNGPEYRALRRRALHNEWMPVCDRCYFPYGGCL